MRSDNKYTLVAWRNEGQPAKAMVRTPLKELVAQLDTEQFAQVHCAVVVNLSAISHVTCGENETATPHLKGRVEVLPVSRSYGHLFREMWRRPAHAWVEPLTGLHSETRLTLKENGLRNLFVSLLGTCLFCTASAAMAQQGSGSVTIDGKTIALPYARAWATGHMLEMPNVEVMLSEKPLKDLNWWASGMDFTEGKYGVVLRLKPALSNESKPADETFQYQFEDDYQMTLYASGFADWIGFTLPIDGVTVTDFSVTKGTVRGQAAWTGRRESTRYMDDPPKTSTVTAWSATFSLPLDEVGPQPK